MSFVDPNQPHRGIVAGNTQDTLRPRNVNTVPSVNEAAKAQPADKLQHAGAHHQGDS